MKKLSEIVIGHPWLIVITTLVVVAAFGINLPKIEMDPSVKNMLPKDMEARLNLDKIEEIFGGSEIVMMIFETDDVLKPATLKRMKKISKKLERNKTVDKVMSPFTLKDIRGESDTMIVDPAIKRIPKNEKGREKLRKTIKENDLVYENIISTDFKAAAIVAVLGTDFTDEEIVSFCEGLAKEFPGDEDVHVAGLPYMRKNLSQDIAGDMKKFLPYGILIMFLFLFLAFKQLRGVLLPGIVVIFSIIVAMGLMPLLGWKIMMITVVLPVILIAVANDYSIHIIAHYQAGNLPELKNLTTGELVTSAVRQLGAPSIVAGLTTMAGLLSLLTHVIIPAKQLGVLAAAGVLFAVIASLTFVPAMLKLLPRAKPVLGKGGQAKGFLDKLLHWTAALVSAHPKRIIIGIIVFTLVISSGIFRIIVDTNPVNYYPADAPVAVSTELANKHFGGSTTLNAIAKGDIKDPAVLNKMEELTLELEKNPNVGKVNSITDIVKRMNKVMNDGDPKFDKIPEARDVVAQYFLLYSMSGEPDDFDKLVDFPYEHALLTARLNSTSTDAMRSVFLETKDVVSKMDNSPFILVGGFAEIFSTLVPLVVNGQMMSLFLSLLFIFILTSLLFKSVMAGAMSVAPLVLSMMILFGLMGYASIELNLVTAMLSSIMIGVGVDYTIHFLWRYREERRAGLEPVDAVFATLTTSGRGIVFNALSVVIGFVVLMLSAFLPVKFFGFLVTVSVLSCLVGALVLLPAIAIIFKPKFLEPLEVKTDSE